MNILYVTHFNPWNPKYGAAMRSHGILRGLIKNHEVHIALATADKNEIELFEQAAEERGFGKMVLFKKTASQAGLSNINTGLVEEAAGYHPDDLPDKSGRDFSMAADEEASRFKFQYVLKNPAGWAVRRPKGSDGSDPLFQSQVFRKPFLKLVNEIKPDLIWYFTKYANRRVGFVRGIPSVLDLDDVPWRKLLMMGSHQPGWKKVHTLSKVIPSWFEDYWLGRQASAVVITNQDETDLLKLNKPVIPVPNGFDFPQVIRIKPRSKKRILFFGSLFYYPNLDGIRWFCQEVWPKVRAAVPEAELDVAGLFSQNLEELGEIEGVNLLGFVDDLNCAIEKSGFLVVPLRIGSGTRIKILEAWSKGLPVVSTTIGAEGLGAEDGKTALIGNTPDELASACIRLLNSPELGMELAGNAFCYAKENFSWDSIHPILDKVLEAALTA
jgi:glycosyltransferase involved in cell wall biosynthesis